MEETRILEIARMLHQQPRPPVSEISKRLGVSGHHIAKVQDMISNGVIVFNLDGEPRFTVPYTKLRAITTGRYRKRTLSPEELSRLTVVETHQEALADEARKQTDAYLTIGRSVFQAFMAWAVKKGYTLEDIRKMPIHQIIVEALEAKDRLPQVEEENKRLTEELEWYRAETDHLVRLRNAVDAIPKTVSYLLLLDSLGFNVEPLADQIGKTMQLYLMGEKLQFRNNHA